MTALKGYIDHGRNEIRFLEKELGEYLKSSSNYPLDKLENTLLKIIANVTYGKDMSSLFPTIVMVTQSKSILVKKLAYHYISVYASLNSELSMLTLNTLKKENVDPDPTIRALSLRAITTLSFEDFGPLITSSIEAALKDKDKYVRKTAIICAYQCGFTTDMKKEYLNQVSDSSFDVHLNSLRILNEMGHFNKGITKSIALHILKRLESADLPGCCFIISLLQKYTPADSDELFKVMDHLDQFINVKSYSVIFATIALFMKYACDFPDYSTDIMDRVCDVLINLLNSSHNRISFLSTLRILDKLMEQNEEADYDKEYIIEKIKTKWRLFIVIESDDINVIKLKLKILKNLVCKENRDAVVSEFFSLLRSHVNEIERKGVRKKIIKTLQKIAIQEEDCLRDIVIGFISFLEFEIPKLSQEIIAYIIKILRNNRKNEEIFTPIIAPYLLQYDTFFHKKSMLWFASKYFSEVEDAHFFLEEVVGQLYNVYKLRAEKQLRTKGHVNIDKLNRLMFDKKAGKGINTDPNEEILKYNKRFSKIIKYKVLAMKAVCYLVFDHPQKMRKMVGALLHTFIKNEHEHITVRNEAFRLYSLIKANKVEELKEYCDKKAHLNHHKKETKRIDSLENIIGFSPVNKFKEEVFEYEPHESLFSNLKLENDEQANYSIREENEEMYDDFIREKDENGEEEDDDSYEYEILSLHVEIEDFQKNWKSYANEKSSIVDGLRGEMKGSEDELINFLDNLNINVVASGLKNNVIQLYGCFKLLTNRCLEPLGTIQNIGEDTVFFELLISSSTNTAKITIKVADDESVIKVLSTMENIVTEG